MRLVLSGLQAPPTPPAPRLLAPKANSRGPGHTTWGTRATRGHLWLGSWSSPVRGGPVPGRCKLTCLAGAHSPWRAREGGRPGGRELGM